MRIHITCTVLSLLCTAAALEPLMFSCLACSGHPLLVDWLYFIDAIWKSVMMKYSNMDFPAVVFDVAAQDSQ